MSREAQIDKIVADTSMGRLQALRHLQGREAAVAADQRRRRAAIDAAINDDDVARCVDQEAFELSLGEGAAKLGVGGRCCVEGLRPSAEIIRPIVADIAERMK